MPADEPADGPPRRTAETTVRSAEGLHMRPVTQLAAAAGRFDAEVRIGRPEGGSADVTSMLEVLALAFGPGETVRIETGGPEGEEALAAVLDLFERDFPEAG